MYTTNTNVLNARNRFSRLDDSECIAQCSIEVEQYGVGKTHF